MLRKSLIAFGLTSGALLATSPAQAGESSGPMLVSALVLESCTVVATPMVFGDVLTLGPLAPETTSTLTLVCTPNADYEIGLDDGINAAGGQRRMKALLRNEYLNYDIFIDAGHSQRWGHTLGVDTKPGTAPLGVAVHTAYGRLGTGPAVGSVAPGEFNDIVTVTVSF